ncbi:hypothetical protein SD10_10855 [Spirosoma radiotolerans]|uniref:Uncharacterized protein n=2 Tax=Spirosoma radiotolerans TaxID=1379870 RepID=A0A0E3V7D0_9BACT|nr:hypothetical protein SD10_10855 [Spirosoma radiotolerans]
MMRVRNKATGIISNVPKGIVPWGSEVVPNDTPPIIVPVVASMPAVVGAVKKAEVKKPDVAREQVVAREPEPVVTREYVQGIDYPYGFDSYQEFLDRTRIIAEQARDGVVIISGSSVTGRSYKTGRDFHTDGHITENSDIDAGIVDNDLYCNERQVDERGFPVRRTRLGDAELLSGSGMRDKNIQMGIKVWAGFPEDREYIVRPHTPPRERRKPVVIEAERKTIQKELSDRRNDDAWKRSKEKK